MLIEYRMICTECAYKIGKDAVEALRYSNFRALPNMGPDSLCDFCGREAGAAEISVVFGSGHEKRTFDLIKVNMQRDKY